MTYNPYSVNPFAPNFGSFGPRPQNPRGHMQTGPTGTRGEGWILDPINIGGTPGTQYSKIKIGGSPGLSADPSLQIYDPVDSFMWGSVQPSGPRPEDSSMLAPRSYEELLARYSQPGTFDWGDYFRPLVSKSGFTSGYDYDQGQEAFKQYQELLAQAQEKSGGSSLDSMGDFTPYAFSQMDESKDYLNPNAAFSDPAYGSLANTSYIYQGSPKGFGKAIDPLTGSTLASFGTGLGMPAGAEEEFRRRVSSKYGNAYMLGRNL